MRQHYCQLHIHNTHAAACTNMIGNYIYTTPMQRHAPTRLGTTYTQHTCSGMHQHDWELHIHNNHAATCTNTIGNYIYTTHMQRHAPPRLGTTYTQHTCSGMHQHNWEPHIHNNHAATCTNMIGNYIYTTHMRLQNEYKRNDNWINGRPPPNINSEILIGLYLIFNRVHLF
jgi:hypothetical protein